MNNHNHIIVDWNSSTFILLYISHPVQVDLLSLNLYMTFVSAGPRIPWSEPGQRQASETKIPIYSKEATAHQESETTIYSKAKLILLTPIATNRHFTLCE